MEKSLAFGALKAKQRLIREDFPDGMGARVHRALSWLGRSEQEGSDADLRFVLLWIGVASVTSGHLEQDGAGEQANFLHFFEALVALDREGRIAKSAWKQFPSEISGLIGNELLYAPFWNHRNGMTGFEDWSARFREMQGLLTVAISRKDTAFVLGAAFERMQTLRTIIVDGGVSWKAAEHRKTVDDACRLLSALLPLVIDIMMDNPHRDWGRPHFPAVN